MKKVNKSETATLRKKEDELLKKKLIKPGTKLSEVDNQKLVHKHGAHQIEQELQHKRT